MLQKEVLQQKQDELANQQKHEVRTVDIDELMVANEVECSASGDKNANSTCDQGSSHHECGHSTPQTEEKGCQTKFQSDFGIHKIKDDAKALEYFTGFRDYEHFKFVFNMLGEAAYSLNYGNRGSEITVMDPEDAFLLTLYKLRRGTADIELGVHFGISGRQAGIIFSTSINFMYCELKEWGITPRDGVESDVKLILDCTEMKITHPSNPVMQQMTYSNYKGTNTLKSLIGIDSRGMVTFISEACGGAYSDRAILEKSGVLDFLEPGDMVLVDHGFNIEDMCAARGLTVNIPASLKGRTQLTPKERLKSSHISSKRIHVERIIGLAKTYKIMKNELHHSKVLLGNRILFVCFMLTNMRFQIVT